jgi:Putative beta-barrel porin 2
VRPRPVPSNVGVENNVFNERENPKSDFTFTAAPDVELSINPGRLRLTYSSRSELVYFRKYATERSTSRGFSARTELDLNVLRPFASYASSHTSARAGSEIDVRARHHPRSVTAGTRVRIASRTSLLLSAGRRWEEFNADETFRGENLADALNSQTTQFEGGLTVSLTPLTSLSLSAVHEQMRFDLSPIRDADSLRIGPTLTFSPLGLLSGTASVGYRRLDGRHSALQDYSGLVASGTLNLILGGRFKFETVFTRDVTYSYEAAAPYYVISGGRGMLASQVVGPLDVRVTGGREVMNYRALGAAESPGRDTVLLYGGGFGYRLAHRVHVAVMAEYRNRQSTRDASRGYDNNRIYATLNWGALTR